MIEAEDSNVQNKSTNRDDAGGEGGVGEKGESHMKFFPSGTTSLCLSLFLQYRTALILYYFFVQSSNFLLYPTAAPVSQGGVRMGRLGRDGLPVSLALPAPSKEKALVGPGFASLRMAHPLIP